MPGNYESRGWWEELGLTVEEFDRMLSENSNVRPGVVGYVAEERFHERHLQPNANISNIRTPEDQDTDDQGDYAFDYRGYEIRTEVKSILDDSVEERTTLDLETAYEGEFHLKGPSDGHEVMNGDEVTETILYDVSQSDVDVFAISLFPFEKEWEFAFIRTEDLEYTESSDYVPELQDRLLKSNQKVRTPLERPYTGGFTDLLDEVIAAR